MMPLKEINDVNKSNLDYDFILGIFTIIFAPLLYIISLTNLKYLFENKIAIIMLLIFTILPGIGTENYNIVWNFLKFLLVFLLIVVGFNINVSSWLKGVKYCFFWLCLISLVNHFFLSHPGQRMDFLIFNSVTLGIAGVLGIIISLESESGLSKGNIFQILVFSLTIFMSESRSAILAMPFAIFWMLNSTSYFRFSLNKKSIAAIIIFIIICLSWIIFQRGFNDSGRILIWLNTLSIAHVNPYFGVGSYGLGLHSVPVSNECQWFPGLENVGFRCPDFLASLQQRWFIAHNSILQEIAEKGFVIGLFCFLVISISIVSLYKSSSASLLAILVCLLVIGSFDSTIIVPSLFFGEIFWIIVGVGLKDVLKNGFYYNVKHLLPFSLIITMSLLPVYFFIALNLVIDRSSNYIHEFSGFPKTQLDSKYVSFTAIEFPRDSVYLSFRYCVYSCMNLRTVDVTSHSSNFVQQIYEFDLPLHAELGNVMVDLVYRENGKYIIASKKILVIP